LAKREVLLTAPGFAGRTADVVSPEQAEDSDMVICPYAGEIREHRKAYTVFTECAKCRSPIGYRNDAPSKPPKLCRNCAFRMVREHRGGYDLVCGPPERI